MKFSNVWAVVDHAECGQTLRIDEGQVEFIRYCPFCGHEIGLIRNTNSGEVVYEDKDWDNRRLN